MGYRAGKAVFRIAKDTTKLIEASRMIDQADAGGLLTKAGRALAKHGNREITVFPRPTGSPANINAQADIVVNEILNDSSRAITYSADEAVFSIRLPSGK